MHLTKYLHKTISEAHEETWHQMFFDILLGKNMPSRLNAGLRRVLPASLQSAQQPANQPTKQLGLSQVLPTSHQLTKLFINPLYGVDPNCIHILITSLCTLFCPRITPIRTPAWFYLRWHGMEGVCPFLLTLSWVLNVETHLGNPCECYIMALLNTCLRTKLEICPLEHVLDHVLKGYIFLKKSWRRSISTYARYFAFTPTTVWFYLTVIFRV